MDKYKKIFQELGEEIDSELETVDRQIDDLATITTKLQEQVYQQEENVAYFMTDVVDKNQRIAQVLRDLATILTD